MTTRDSADIDATGLDFFSEVELPSINDGKLDFSAVLPTLPPFDALRLSECTSLEILDVALLDDTGAAFARLGTAVLPKD